MLAECQTLIELTQLKYGFQHTGIREIILSEDVFNCFSSQFVKRIFHEARQTEFKLHQVAHQHHQILSEVLELDEIYIDILQFMTILTDTGIDFLEEGIISIIDILHHFLHLCLLANTQTVVDRRNMQTCLENTQVWQHRQIGDT